MDDTTPTPQAQRDTGGRRLTLADLRAMSADDRRAVLPNAARVLGEFLAEARANEVQDAGTPVEQFSA